MRYGDESLREEPVDKPVLTVRPFLDSFLVEDKTKDVILGVFNTKNDAEQAAEAIAVYVTLL
jgi:hypothetical protein